MSRVRNSLLSYLKNDRRLIHADEMEDKQTSVSSGGDLSNYGEVKLSAAEERRKAEQAAVDKQYSTAQSLADEQHRAALRQQAQQRADSKREAYIAHERLQKYLPQVQAAAGTEGMGMSETAKVQGLNAYLGQRSAADAAYGKGVADLEAAKGMADTERSLARQEAENAVLQRYLDTKEAVAADRSAAVGSMVGSKAAAYQGADGKLSLEDYQKLADYVEQHRGMMTPDDQVLMDLTLEGYREQVRTDAEQMAMSKTEFVDKGVKLDKGLTNYGLDGNNFTVKDANGNTYKVQLDAKDGAVTDSDVVTIAKQTNIGDIFAYNNRLYLNNGTEVYGIEARDNSAKEDWNALYDLFFQGGAGKGSDQRQTLAAYGSGNDMELGPRMVKNQALLKAVKGMKTGEIISYGNTKIIKHSDGEYYQVK